MRHAYAPNGPILDSIQYTTCLPTCLPTPELHIVSRKYLRRMCCLLLVLWRTLHITTVAEVAGDIDASTDLAMRSAFQEHHLECSVDAFSTLQHMIHLAPGMRLVYRTDFNGMYNDVSQVS